MEQYRALKLLNPLFFVRHHWQERRLIKQFAMRDFQIRYQGTFLGVIWSLIVPLIMLLVYTFVFSVVFKARWGDLGNQSKAMFAVILFGNLIPFNIFSDVVGSSPGLIIHNSNLVKKVIFPLEILPISRLIAVVLQSLLSFVVLFAGIAMVDSLKIEILYAPLILGPLLLFALGISYFVSSFSVFVRDVGQLIGVLLTLLLFLSPIFYPLQSVPEDLRVFILLNPFALLIEEFRSVMILGQAPQLHIVCVLWISSIIVTLLGFTWFMKSKLSFADVM